MRSPCAYCGGPTKRPERTYCSRKCSGLAHVRPAEERFWEKVEKTNGCWLWTGCLMSSQHKDSQRYGHFMVEKRRGIGAHRFSWELHNGPIPAGMYVCHTCDTPRCVHPDHLWLGSHKDNMDDRERKGRTVPPPLRPVKARPDEFLRLRMEGVSNREIALRFGVVPETVGLAFRELRASGVDVPPSPYRSRGKVAA